MRLRDDKKRRIFVMGQGHSLPDPDRVVGRLQSHLGIIKRIANLKYEEFVQSINELNSLTSTFSDTRGKQLKFYISKGTDETIFWKPTVRICCEKIRARSNFVESSRLLNLRQYIMIYMEITEQVSNLSTGGASKLSHEICASVIFNEAGEIKEDEENECCICMETKSEIILPCAHKFCEGCIDTWNVTSKTCPICRARVNSIDDTWVLTEKPDSTEYESEVKGYLVGLADRTGNPH